MIPNQGCFDKSYQLFMNFLNFSVEVIWWSCSAVYVETICWVSGYCSGRPGSNASYSAGSRAQLFSFLLRNFKFTGASMPSGETGSRGCFGSLVSATWVLEHCLDSCCTIAGI
jgi:hypothetical protein